MEEEEDGDGKRRRRHHRGDGGDDEGKYNLQGLPLLLLFARGDGEYGGDGGRSTVVPFRRRRLWSCRIAHRRRTRKRRKATTKRHRRRRRRRGVAATDFADVSLVSSPLYCCRRRGAGVGCTPAPSPKRSPPSPTPCFEGNRRRRAVTWSRSVQTRVGGTARPSQHSPQNGRRGPCRRPSSSFGVVVAAPRRRRFSSSRVGLPCCGRGSRTSSLITIIDVVAVAIPLLLL